MTQKFAQYDEAERIIGFYDEEIHRGRIPERAIPITDDDWHRHVDGDVIWRVDVSGKEPKLVPYTPPPPLLADVQAHARREMAQWIDRFTGLFTDGYSRDEIAAWPVKAAAARAQLAGTAQPIIAAEAELTGETPAELAETIVARAELFQTIIAKVTGLRRVTDDAIGAAETPEAVAAELESALAKATELATELGLSVPATAQQGG